MELVDVTIRNLLNLCENCSYYGKDECKKEKCNVGFSFTIMDNIKNENTLQKNVWQIPNEDAKYYDEKKVARSIASICKMCKECNENHTESCPISIARKSMEGIVLKEILHYPGNVLSYLVNVGKQNSDFSNLILEEFRKQS